MTDQVACVQWCGALNPDSDSSRTSLSTIVAHTFAMEGRALARAHARARQCAVMAQLAGQRPAGARRTHMCMLQSGYRHFVDDARWTAVIRCRAAPSKV